MCPNDGKPRSIILSKELQSYKADLQKTLGQTKDFEGFSTLIGRELVNKFGIEEWVYASLDFPDGLLSEEHLGVINQEYVCAYSENVLHKKDLLLQHVKNSDRPIFQSDIESDIKKLTFVSEKLHGYMEVVALLSEFGYQDTCCIPMTSNIDGGRYIVSLNSRTKNGSKFRESAANHIEHLTILADTINIVGTKNFPKYFVSPLKEYRAISSSRSLEVLEHLFKKDKTVAQTAADFAISVSTADKHLKKLRNKLGVKTNQGAYEFARSRGLID